MDQSARANRRVSGVVLCPARACHGVITVIAGDHAKPYVQWCSLLHGPVECEQRCLSTLPPSAQPQPLSGIVYRQLRPLIQLIYERLAGQRPPRFPAWQRWAQALLAGVGTAADAWRAAESVRAQAMLLAEDDVDLNLALAAETAAWACVQAHSGRDSEAAACAAQAHSFLGADLDSQDR